MNYIKTLVTYIRQLHYIDIVLIEKPQKKLHFFLLIK